MQISPFVPIQKDINFIIIRRFRGLNEIPTLLTSFIVIIPRKILTHQGLFLLCLAFQHHSGDSCLSTPKASFLPCHAFGIVPRGDGFRVPLCFEQQADGGGVRLQAVLRKGLLSQPSHGAQGRRPQSAPPHTGAFRARL